MFLGSLRVSSSSSSLAPPLSSSSPVPRSSLFARPPLPSLSSFSSGVPPSSEIPPFPLLRAPGSSAPSVALDLASVPRLRIPSPCSVPFHLPSTFGSFPPSGYGSLVSGHPPVRPQILGAPVSLAIAGPSLSSVPLPPSASSFPSRQSSQPRLSALPSFHSLPDPSLPSYPLVCNFPQPSAPPVSDPAAVPACFPQAPVFQPAPYGLLDAPNFPVEEDFHNRSFESNIPIPPPSCSSDYRRMLDFIITLFPKAKGVVLSQKLSHSPSNQSSLVIRALSLPFRGSLSSGTFQQLFRRLMSASRALFIVRSLIILFFPELKPFTPPPVSLWKGRLSLLMLPLKPCSLSHSPVPATSAFP